MPTQAEKTLTANRLSPLWLRVTGRSRWTPVQAFVFSSEYVPRQPSALSHYHVVYSYKVEGNRYVGQFDDFASSKRFKPEEMITISYNPHHPERSYFVGQYADTYFFVAILTFMVLMAGVVIFANLPSR